MRGLAMAAVLAGAIGAGCATQPKSFVFTKANAADAVKEADSKACWKYTLETPEGRNEAALFSATQLIGGGILGGVDVGTSNDPRFKSANQQTHVACMKNKGYTVAGMR